MEDILDEPEIISHQDNLFFTILTHTTDTFRFILKDYASKYRNLIINWYGVSFGIGLHLEALIRHDKFSMLSLIFLSLVGWLLSWFLIYLNSFLMSWTGEWIGGR